MNITIIKCEFSLRLSPPLASQFPIPAAAIPLSKQDRNSKISGKDDSVKHLYQSMINTPIQAYTTWDDIHEEWEHI